MAMNDDMNDLLAMYRKAAREAPSPMADARILRAADKVAAQRRWSRNAMWPAAIAASILLWSAWHGYANHPARRAIVMAGDDADASRVELLQMDVTPPPSDLDHFLLNVGTTRDQPMTRHAR